MIGKDTASRSLVRDERGASVIEMAFALPLVITLMIGILWFGMILHTNGAMRHAIGEGVRIAKVDWDATDAQIIDATKAALVGVNTEGLQSVVYQKGTVGSATYGRITMKFVLDPEIPFVDLEPIVLEETRQAWLPT